MKEIFGMNKDLDIDDSPSKAWVLVSKTQEVVAIISESIGDSNAKKAAIQFHNLMSWDKFLNVATYSKELRQILSDFCQRQCSPITPDRDFENELLEFYRKLYQFVESQLAFEEAKAKFVLIVPPIDRLRNELIWLYDSSEAEVQNQVPDVKKLKTLVVLDNFQMKLGALAEEQLENFKTKLAEVEARWWNVGKMKHATNQEKVNFLTETVDWFLKNF